MNKENEIFFNMNSGRSVVGLITPKINVNAVNRDNGSLLLNAIVNSQYDVAQALLTLGADPNIVRDSDKTSPLMHLFWTQEPVNKDLVQLFLDCGADVNAVDHDGWTPLMYSYSGQHREVAFMLLDHGAELFEVSGRTVNSEDGSKKLYDYTVHEFISLMANEQPEFRGLLQSIDAYVNSKKAIELTEQNGAPRRNKVFF